MFKYFKNLDDVKKRLFKSVYGFMMLSIAVYIFTLLSIIVTAIDYKHISVNIKNTEKETLNIE